MSLRVTGTALAGSLLGQARRNEQTTQTALERLSSGLRINRAADDAAGLAISDRLRAQVAGGNQALRNTQDAVSLLNTIDGALSQVSDALGRMRELALRSLNGTLSDADRAHADQEVSQLMSELVATVSGASFNGVRPLATNGTLTFQVGANAGQTVAVTMVDAATLVTTSGFTSGSVATRASAQALLGSLDYGQDYLATYRTGYAVVASRLQHTADNLAVTSQNLAAAYSQIRDADVARESTALTRGLITANAAVAAISQLNVATSRVKALLAA